MKRELDKANAGEQEVSAREIKIEEIRRLYFKGYGLCAYI